MARQLHEVVLDDADDMEAVGDDPGSGEGVFDEAAVGAGEVDADDPHLLPALELAKEPGEILMAAAGLDVENTPVFQVTEGGGEALALVEGVLVDAEVARALQGEAFGGFAAGELLVDAGNGGLADFVALGERAGADAIVVELVDGFAEGLGAVASGPDAGEPGDEAAATLAAQEAASVDDELCGLLKAVEVADRAEIRPFADEAGALAMGTAFGSKLRGKLDMNLGGSRFGILKGVVPLQAYI